MDTPRHTETPQHAFEACIRALDGYAAAARKLGVKTAWGVQKWGRDGVPPLRVIEFASLAGFVRTPHQLRPDLYPHPDDGLPPERRVGSAPADILEQLRDVITEDELRELTAAIDRGHEFAYGYVQGLAKKHGLMWSDLMISQGLATERR